MNNQGKSRIKHPMTIVGILLLLFIIPFTLAWVLYSEHNILSGTTNHGNLIQPPFSISEINLYNKNGEKLDNRFNPKLLTPSATRTNGKWMLLVLNPGPCDKNCETWLYNIRQIRLASGKDRNRIERVILTYKNAAPDNNLNNLLIHQYQGTRHLTVNAQQFQSVIHKNVKQPYALEQGTVYVVDPLGNVMMSYRPDANSTGIFKDVKRLLKVSQIG